MPSVEAPDRQSCPMAEPAAAAPCPAYETAVERPILSSVNFGAAWSSYPLGGQTQRSGRTPSVTSRGPRDPVAPYFRMNPR
jgi:hypothetical protein